MTTPSGKVRSFIAIPAPGEWTLALEETVKRLDAKIGKDVRWVRPEGIHLTLKFMGDIQAETVERVLAVLPEVTARFSPFTLFTAGMGVFPNPRRPRVLWAGVGGDLETLSVLQAAVDEAVGRLGLPKEQRAFSPHLTLGRVRRDVPDGRLADIGRLVAGGELPGLPPWTADTVNLMRTELDPAGSRHYLVGSALIGGG
ncbi:MAG: RNA 2',3'-cyclic phosphodiesterase [Chloroflexi bacterium]|nr:RNA 2',3'-cyclic phosphodiesterase [Chloroflexota bacterium]MDA1269990.1 RNA 2',3'-cyclic phosphodiesterase [Chloroflexota bacterium]PKB59187.1 MAG: 2'-5' RNA ligase [SAR202 cluster bacterium Casp-Chloro-G2]